MLGARRFERPQALAKQLSLGNDVAAQIDVTQYAQVKNLVDRAVPSHGRVGRDRQQCRIDAAVSP